MKTKYYCVGLFYIHFYALQFCKGETRVPLDVPKTECGHGSHDAERLAIDALPVEVEISAAEDHSEATRKDKEAGRVQVVEIPGGNLIKSLLLNRIIDEAGQTAESVAPRAKRTTQPSKQLDGVGYTTLEQTAKSKSSREDIPAFVARAREKSIANYNPEQIQSLTFKDLQSQSGDIGRLNVTGGVSPPGVISKLIQNSETKRKIHTEMQDLHKKKVDKIMDCSKGKSYPMPFETSASIHRLLDSLENYIGNVVLRTILDETLNNVLQSRELAPDNTCFNGDLGLMMLIALRDKMFRDAPRSMALKEGGEGTRLEQQTFNDQQEKQLNSNAVRFYGGRANPLPVITKNKNKKLNMFSDDQKGSKEDGSNEISPD